MNEQNKKIVFFFTGFVYGGGERVTTDIARELKGRGDDVELVFLYSKERYKRIPEDIPVHFLGASSLMKGVSLLTEYVQVHTVHTVFTTQEHAHVLSLLAQRKAKHSFRTVLRFGLPPSKFFANMKSVKDRFVLPLLARWLFPKADVVIGNSKHTSDELVQYGIPRGKIYTIYNPLRPGYKELSKADAPHDWLKNKIEPVILGFGRLEPQKDFPTLVRAFAKLRESVPSRLIILGEGSQREKLLALANELDISDRVDLPGGYVENPLAWMAHADVFVLPSKFEGFPNVLVEAMAAGTPVVAADCVSGPREILNPNHKSGKSSRSLLFGEFGLLVPVGDSDAFAQAIKLLLTDTKIYTTYKTRAEERVQEFGSTQILDDYSKVLFESYP